MVKDNKERFGNANEINPNWIKLKEDVASHRAQYLNNEHPIWPKPKDFAETYGYKLFDTTEFRNRYNKARDELLCKFCFCF